MPTLHPLLGNSQWLDGGAMFGNVPKALWSRWVTPDAANRIPLACRALLIQEDKRRILLETGAGAFFEPNLKARYGIVEPEHVLLKELANINLTHEDIDVVILSHLHFDHAGGLLSPWEAGKASTLLFPNAQFITSQTAWERAQHPHFRDRASFLPELNKLLQDSGRLLLVEKERCDLLGDEYRFHYSHGHTPGMLLTEITTPQGPLVFAADLVPGTPWVHLPITMGYDRFPECVINEKQHLLEDLLSRQGRLFYTHDPRVAASGIGKDAKGRFVAIDTVETL